MKARVWDESDWGGDLANLADTAARHFQEHYRAAPLWLAAAPGRVNLIGEHIDYNDGVVVPMAIERFTVVAAGRKSNSHRSPNTSSVYSVNVQSAFEILNDCPNKPGDPAWGNYVRGIWEAFRSLDIPIPPLNVLIYSSVPAGSGLSSSAALGVAIASALEVAVGQPLEPLQKVEICQRAEHDFAGVPCGLMDPYTSVFGEADSLLVLDCRDRSSRSIPFADEVGVLVVDTHVRHQLAGGEYRTRREQCAEVLRALGVHSFRDIGLKEFADRRHRLSRLAARRASHVVSEMDRTEKFVRAIEQSNWMAAGSLLQASHRSLREDFEVSCRELDVLVDLLHDPGEAEGVYGAKMTGGGFGGCVVALIQAHSADTIVPLVLENYRQATGKIASAFVTRPAQGARILR